MSDNSIDFYVDIKSPYAYLALDPAIEMFDQLGLRWNLLPYTLNIADYLGSATVNNKGEIISSNRTALSGVELNIPTWIAEGWLIYRGKQF